MSNVFHDIVESSVVGLGYGGNSGAFSSSVDNLMNRHQENCCLELAEPSPAIQQRPVLQFVSSKIDDQSPSRLSHGEVENSSQTERRGVLEQAKENPQEKTEAEGFDQKKKEATEPSKAVLLESNQPVEAAVARAKAIVAKFQLQKTPQDDLSPVEYRAKRISHFVKERERLRVAMIKNFEYVVKREEERLQKQFQQIQQTRHFENDLQRQHELQLQRRKTSRQQLQSQAGVGTVKRQRIERSRERKRNAKSGNANTVAVYLEGLPVTIREETIRSLFGSYGMIQKVHFYRHKETGELKGDGLVIYELGPKTTSNELLDSICFQMNGCELPCGSIMRVQPANSDQSNNRQRTTKGEECNAHSSSRTPTPVPKVTEENSADDLNDFFASL